MTGRAVRSVCVGEPTWFTALLVAMVGVLAPVVGVAGAVPASAATVTYAYDTFSDGYDNNKGIVYQRTGAEGNAALPS